MWLKEMLKRTFSDENKIILERYRWAKLAFIISSFLFFINFYFVWANFYLDFFWKTLGVIYIILLLSLVFYVYFFIKKLLIWKIPKFVFIIILIFLLLIFGFLVLPIIVEWGFNYILGLIKLYS